MKLSLDSRRVAGRTSVRQLSGMTLVETMVATFLMVTIVIGGLLSANYVGMRQDQLVESKAGASDTSRHAISLLLEDIRLAKGYSIGSYAGSVFTACVNDAAQQGGSLMLYPVVNSTNQAVDTSQYILYYYDTSDNANNDGRLWRSASLAGSTTAATVIASNLISTMSFASENFQGLVQTNRTYKGVIHTTLHFCEFQYPLTQVGSNDLYEFYQIDCRATPHLPDGP
jgi:Tfp pilus assembly protein PilW